jgi:hypothetical protein
LRKKGGKYDKDGDFTSVSWNDALGIMTKKWKGAAGDVGFMRIDGRWVVATISKTPMPSCAPTLRPMDSSAPFRDIHPGTPSGLRIGEHGKHPANVISEPEQKTKVNLICLSLRRLRVRLPCSSVVVHAAT